MQVGRHGAVVPIQVPKVSWPGGSGVGFACMLPSSLYDAVCTCKCRRKFIIEDSGIGMTHDELVDCSVIIRPSLPADEMNCHPDRSFGLHDEDACGRICMITLPW